MRITCQTVTHSCALWKVNAGCTLKIFLHSEIYEDLKETPYCLMTRKVSAVIQSGFTTSGRKFSTLECREIVQSEFYDGMSRLSRYIDIYSLCLMLLTTL